MSLAGKVVVITGGGSGMGQFAARQYAQQGAKVALLDVNEAGMVETAEGHPEIHSYKVDVTDLEQMRSAIDSIEADVGPIFRVMNCLSKTLACKQKSWISTGKAWSTSATQPSTRCWRAMKANLSALPPWPA